MKIVLVDRSAADRKYYRILLSQSLLAHSAAAAAGGSGAGSVRELVPRPSSGSQTHDEFFEASLGVQGLELCRKIRPDCILVDYQLPDMDGLEFLAEQKAEAGEPCPVIMLTGLASEQAAQSSLRAGAQDYLVKDRVNAETLRLAVEKAIQQVRLVRELQAERERLAQAVADRDVLLAEFHHRVKNHLQIIVSLLRMQAGILPEANSDQIPAAEVLRDCLHRVEAISLVQDQLQGQSSYIDFGRQATLLLGNLCVAFGAGPEQIERRVDTETTLTLRSEQAVPVALLLNELISNALKHAFPDGRKGFIEVAARLDQGNVEVSVRDNGVGIVAQGLDAANRDNLGLKIVQVLTRQLKGTIRMEHEGGTAFHIVFPQLGAAEARETDPQKAAPARKLPGSTRNSPALDVVSYNGPSPAARNPYARPAPKFGRIGK